MSNLPLGIRTTIPMKSGPHKDQASCEPEYLNQESKEETEHSQDTKSRTAGQARGERVVQAEGCRVGHSGVEAAPRVPLPSLGCRTKAGHVHPHRGDDIPLMARPVRRLRPLPETYCEKPIKHVFRAARFTTADRGQDRPDSTKSWCFVAFRWGQCRSCLDCPYVRHRI